MPECLDEATPWSRPPARAHPRRDRAALAGSIGPRRAQHRAARRGFYSGGGRGSWFDLGPHKALDRGIVTYPGPIDLVHEWAYLPDLVAAMVRLAAVPRTARALRDLRISGPCRELGATFRRRNRKAGDRGVRIKRMYWWLIHALSPVVAAAARALRDGYLWKVPHRNRGDKLKAAIGEVPHTPLDVAVAKACGRLATTSKSADDVLACRRRPDGKPVPTFPGGAPTRLSRIVTEKIWKAWTSQGRVSMIVDFSTTFTPRR